jgi:HPt (histidine-containing phosphotransfer) domain-containing protein
MRLLTLFVLLAALCGLAPAQAQETRPGCDSCAMHINTLTQPTKLAGTWLFTRDDAPGNAAVDADTRNWVLIKAPGPWKKAYGDGKVFEVGWYRGTFDFAPDMVGQEVVVLMNAYMGRVRVYVDGNEVYHRPDNINVQRYYSIQPIPVRFKVTQAKQVIAMRVETPLMTGLYMLPLELHRYDQADSSLVFYQFWGGELRTIAAYVSLMFGLFFLLVYAKVRYSMYLVAALGSIVIFPFFAAPGDYLLGIFQPETLLYLHYPGLFACFFFYLFSQYFHKFTPKLNWGLGGVMGVLALLIGSMAIHPSVDLFQHVRSVYFVLTLACGLGATYMFARGVRHQHPGSGALLTGMLVFLATGVNDLLLAVGAVASISMIFTGVLVFVLTMLYVASSSFANTFVENKRLVNELTGMNENLEGLVAERTLALRQKTNDIQSMMQNMPQGVLTVTAGNQIHPEYSAFLETIFETQDIAGKPLMDIVFARSSLGADALSQIEVTVGSCIGEDAMNYEFNAHLLATEFDIETRAGQHKSLELSWSPIANEADEVEKLMICVRDVTELKRLAKEASAQKRELEMIGEILGVTQEKFQEFVASSRSFLQENRALLFTSGDGLPSAEQVQVLFRNMHTIKGNARTYGLLHLTNTVHEAEQAYDQLRQGHPGELDGATLQTQLQAVNTLVEDYAKINDTTLGRKGPGRRGSVDRFVMIDRDQMAQALARIDSVNRASGEEAQQALAEVEQMLRQLGTKPVSQVIAGIVESLPSLAQELGKAAPVVAVHDQGVLLKNQVMGLVRNLFTHLMRNAVDHGLETPERRAAAGKPAQGRIDLTVALNAQQLSLVLRDDGQGMALNRIRAIAQERGLVAPSAQLSDEQVADLIFMPGFSTAEQVTEVSGRGVGMDAVKGFLEAEGGQVAVHFLGAATAQGHRPFEIRITLPAQTAIQSSPGLPISQTATA